MLLGRSWAISPQWRRCTGGCDSGLDDGMDPLSFPCGLLKTGTIVSCMEEKICMISNGMCTLKLHVVGRSLYLAVL